MTFVPGWAARLHRMEQARRQIQHQLDVIDRQIVRRMTAIIPSLRAKRTAYRRAGLRIPVRSSSAIAGILPRSRPSGSRKSMPCRESSRARTGRLPYCVIAITCRHRRDRSIQPLRQRLAGSPGRPRPQHDRLVPCSVRRLDGPPCTAQRDCMTIVLLPNVERLPRAALSGAD